MSLTLCPPASPPKALPAPLTPLPHLQPSNVFPVPHSPPGPSLHPPPPPSALTPTPLSVQCHARRHIAPHPCAPPCCRTVYTLFPLPPEAASVSFSARAGGCCRGQDGIGPWPPLNPLPSSRPTATMTEQMTLRGTLKGHNGWVTQIATTPQFPDMILSASRGEGRSRPGRGVRGDHRRGVVEGVRRPSARGGGRPLAWLTRGTGRDHGSSLGSEGGP